VRFVEIMGFKKIKGLLQLSNNDDFLDIGSGYLLNQAVCKRGVGADISDLMVKTAKENCENGGKKFVVQPDAENLPFKNSSFDKIVSTKVIKHILHSMALLEEIERVSRKDTVIVITIPNGKRINWVKNIFFSLGVHKLLFRKSYRPSRRIEEAWPLHAFDLKKFKALIEGKFVIKKIIPIPTPFFPVRYVFGLMRVC
jgi:ubiquinone/menaquinone biosynthesis C-methylase UbiE